ncbi:MAG: class I SAM-dependent methyltransferase [Bacteroidales bacterium]|jgi:adenine-specific DNA-methyltransferase|nr:class I SAM-dependent methyltransferase [Bacteroidales bacterium]
MKNSRKQLVKNKFGQYFTPKMVADFMIGLADIMPNSRILEPSCGQGIFLDLLQQKEFKNVTAYEIDDDLAKKFQNVKYESFVTANIKEKYDLIIGNPPYIRWKNLADNLKQELATNPLWNKYCNSLCDYLYIFIIKSIELLNDNGQLIFICPEYWMNTTHSVSLRNYMVANGFFEEIYHFNETPIFDKVTVSTIIFKYIKSKQKKDNIKVAKYYLNQKLTVEILDKLKTGEPCSEADFFNVPQFKVNERWLLQTAEIQKELNSFENNCRKMQQTNTLFALFDDEETKQEFHTIGEFCDIGNGLVSGLDKAFQVNGDPLNEFEKQAIIKVVKAKDLSPFYHNKITPYIYIPEGLSEKEVIEKYPHFYKHFLLFRHDLEKRYQYNRLINFWEWVFLRNFNLFSSEKKRIFVPCKERISNKNYFRFSLVDEQIYPTQDVTAIFKKEKTKESLEYILAYLNNPCIFDWLKCNGIVKGNIVEFSEKPISSIPFRPINWKKPKEIELHDEITNLTLQYIDKKEDNVLNKINHSINKLINL